MGLACGTANKVPQYVQRTREPRAWLGTARILRQRRLGHIKVIGTVKTSIISVVI
jgi:hypothetical protein